jgi:hypothetical protein
MFIFSSLPATDIKNIAAYSSFTSFIVKVQVSDSYVKYRTAITS